MESLLSARLQAGRDRLKLLSERRVLTAPTAYLDDKRMLLLTLSRDLERGVQGSVDYKKHQFARLSAVLEAVSPLKVIAKGYSAVFAEDGKLIRSVKDVKTGDAVSFRTADGTVDASVTAVRGKEFYE
jgi:exodeoxyribonuclease VII large subunit